MAKDDEAIDSLNRYQPVLGWLCKCQLANPCFHEKEQQLLSLFRDAQINGGCL